MREYIFGHVQRGTEPLTGEDLAAAICEVARSLPGFDSYCSHQVDLEQRAMFYARSIQSSHYYPFGSKHQAKTSLSPDTVTEPTQPNRNQQKSQEARDRIRQAVTDLLTKNALPMPVTARRQAIKAYGIGNATLDKYKELWHPHYLKALPEGQYHTLKDNKLVPTAAAYQGRAVGFQEVGRAGGFSTGLAVEATNRKAVRAEQWLAKMQVWSESGDWILVAEAQRFFTAHAQKESVSLGSMDVVIPEQLEGCSSEEAVMPGGFGRSQPQCQGGKTALQEIWQLSVVSQPPVQDAVVNLAMQAEVAAFFTQYQQEHPEETVLAWSAGVHNPLAQVDLLAVGARYLEPEEEDWLALARMVGWLTVEEELDAIYFTAPPPSFVLEQADWYVRSNLTTFLESPVLLRDVVQQYPITEASIRGAIDQRVQQWGWTGEQRTRFMLEVCEQPEAALTQADWELLLFELRSRLQDLG